MFKPLSAVEQGEVRRWQAPQLGTDMQDGVLSRRVGRAAGQGACDAAGGPNPADGQDAAFSDLPGGVIDTSMRGPSAEMLQTSYDEGYAEGFTEGTVAAGAEATRRMSDWLAAFETASSQRNEALEAETLALARAMARLILHREVEQDGSVMRGIVRQALELLPERAAQAAIRMNPQDASVVRGLMQDNPVATIVDDDTLARGDCLVESGAATVNAGIDQWLEAIASTVTEPGAATAVIPARPHRNADEAKAGKSGEKPDSDPGAKLSERPGTGSEAKPGEGPDDGNASSAVPDA